MKSLANSTVKCFGYDQTNTVTYCFNELGFRNKYNTGTSINIVGNSIAFGIGLDEHQTFGFLLSQKLGLPCNNFGFGCYYHENHDHLANLKILSQRSTDDIFIVQINNLDRYRNKNNVVTTDNCSEFSRKRFLDYFDQVLDLTADRRTMLLYWDDQSYNLPKSVIDKISIVNKFHLDYSIASNQVTFGPRSHRAIAEILASLYLR
jgi:hypothetical protein